MTKLVASLTFRWGIASILTVSLVGAIVLLLAFTALLDIRRQRAIFQAETKERGLMLADTLNDVLADALYFTDIDKIDEIATLTAQQPGLRYIQVFNADGRLLTDTRRKDYPFGSIGDDVRLRLAQDFQPLIQFDTDSLEVVSPILIGTEQASEMIGFARFSFDTSIIEPKIRAIIRQHIGQGLGLFAVGVGVSYFIARRFTQPIQRLVAATEKMASGQLETRVEVGKSDELGELAHSFNIMAQELQAKVAALQESRRRIVMAQEGVRQEIASHLHGSVQGKLLVLKGRLQQLQEKTNPLPETAQFLGEVIDAIGQVAQDELSTLSRRLYPSILRRGLVPSLRSLGSNFQGAFVVDLQVSEELARQEGADRSLIPEPVRLAVYRIAEEALTNAVKHTRAHGVTLQLDWHEEDLRLQVRDDGQGFDPQTSIQGLGMAAMQDYAGAVGGFCTILSIPGEGTEVVAVLPLAPGPGAEPPGKGIPWE